MGYEKYTVEGFRRRPRLVHARRAALIFALVFSFIVSMFPNLSPHDAVAAQLDEPTHEMTHGHDVAAHDDMTGAHDAADLQGIASHPCDHDCDCHASAIASCCAQSASVAAIWTSLPTSPQFRAARCTGSDGGYPASWKIDPPTPPPRTVLS